jgi:hypothetical protein
VAAIFAWGLGTYAYIYFMSRLFYNGLERTMTRRGIGAATNGTPSAGIPVNSLYAMSNLASPDSLTSNLLEGTNHDTLSIIGWLELSKAGGLACAGDGRPIL